MSRNLKYNEEQTVENHHMFKGKTAIRAAKLNKWKFTLQGNRNYIEEQIKFVIDIINIFIFEWIMHPYKDK